MLKLLQKCFSCLALTALASAAQAQQEAIPPIIRIVVPFAAGASTDVIARKLAPDLATRLRTNVIVENRAGGSSLIGTAAVAKGPKDGSILLLTTPSLVTAVATMKDIPFDLNNDLVPVSMINEGPMIIGVSVKTDIKTPADLVAAARARPDGLSYGSSGIGTLLHLSTELLNDAAGIRMRHIPYKGAALGAVDLAAGTIDLMIAAQSTLAPHIKSGRVRPIAVTSLRPSPAFPDLPPMSSAAPGFAADLWAVVFAPAGTPPALVQRLNREFNEAAAGNELREYNRVEGALPTALPPDELARRIRDSVGVWKKIATQKSITAE